MRVLAPSLCGTKSAAASTHWLATSTAMQTMAAGGNAVDAAVAAGFALQVLEPQSNGLGGDVVIAVYSAQTREVKIVCGQGPMPLAASLDAFDGLDLGQVPASGLLPATVPGGFGAWLRALSQFGTKSLADVLDAAIGYATDGIPVLASASHTIEAVAPVFRDHWKESAQIYLPGGKVPAAGSRLRNPALADTYRRLLAEAQAATSREAQIELAHAAFYRGFVAEAIDAFAQTEVFDSTGRRNRGLLRGDDMATWQPGVEAPATLHYRGYDVFKPGLWTQGPAFLQQLGILAGFDLAALTPGTKDYVHLLAEAAKLAFADREGWYGDAGADVTEALLAREYLAERAAMITQTAATDPEPGIVRGQKSWMPNPRPEPTVVGEPSWMAHLRSGLPTVTPGGSQAGAGNTCTVAVMDAQGNLVVAVPSGGWLKSSPVMPDLGFSLGTRGQTTWLAEVHPNALTPGRRPRTTLSPTVVLRDGDPYLGFGTPGGDQQDQWTLQAFLSVVEFGQPPQEAVNQPAFHIDHFPQSFTPRVSRPGTIVAEQDFDPEVLAGLTAAGHRLGMVPSATLGKVCMVGMDPTTGFLRAAASGRGRQAYAASS